MGFHYKKSGKKCVGCGYKSCHCGGKKTMKDVINGIYRLKGQNYLDPTNPTMGEGFWSAGQPSRRTYPKRG